MMKGSIFLYLLFILSFWGCQKDIDEYLPKIQTHSADMLSTGDVIARALILSEGAAPVSLAGFCADTIGNPQMHQLQLNEVYTSGESDTLVGFFTEHIPNKKY